ncbi:hypothetical protein [Hydrogenophaga sp.]|uniref:hypothetical protein n=1 Tax=Hydrogenophaga sp. TaxID=1904254 RepID=UPI0019B3F5F1|nr:hypothetical protein [Hydrogenophaga sp.]MBD3893115.1 hypothetical protein [Hydrogenophaga sp.]
MFDIQFNPLADRHDGAAAEHGTRLMPLACPAHPQHAYELLCTLAAQLTALGQRVVIIDASATEPPAPDRDGGGPIGLLSALQDPSISGLGRAAHGADWLVMPGALGLHALQQTAQLAGASTALARLLAPFASGSLVLLFAPAFALTQLLSGLSARALVPVLNQPQSSIDAYGTLKLLHAAGLIPVLAPLELSTPELPQVPLSQVLTRVSACAQRHLGLRLHTWPLQTWGLQVLQAALVWPPHPPHTAQTPPWNPAAAARGTNRAGVAPGYWS